LNWWEGEGTLSSASGHQVKPGGVWLSTAWVRWEGGESVSMAWEGSDFWELK